MVKPFLAQFDCLIQRMILLNQFCPWAPCSIKCRYQVPQYHHLPTVDTERKSMELLLVLNVSGSTTKHCLKHYYFVHNYIEQSLTSYYVSNYKNYECWAQ